jgi:hypothetical protein
VRLSSALSGSWLRRAGLSRTTRRHDEARKPAAPVEVKRVAGNGADVVKEFTIFWPEESFKAVGLDKKEHGMREVCNTCRVSLVQNQCANPTILGGIRVNIVPR